MEVDQSIVKQQSLVDLGYDEESLHRIDSDLSVDLEDLIKKEKKYDSKKEKKYDSKKDKKIDKKKDNLKE